MCSFEADEQPKYIVFANHFLAQETTWEEERRVEQTFAVSQLYFRQSNSEEGVEHSFLLSKIFRPDVAELRQKRSRSRHSALLSHMFNRAKQGKAAEHGRPVVGTLEQRVIDCKDFLFQRSDREEEEQKTGHGLTSSCCMQTRLD